MVTHTTYTQARARLADLCNAVAANRDVVVIRRRGAEDVALVSAAELESLMETAHLLRSPRNAERLLKALTRARGGEGEAQTVDDLRREVGLGDAR